MSLPAKRCAPYCHLYPRMVVIPYSGSRYADGTVRAARDTDRRHDYSLSLPRMADYTSEQVPFSRDSL
jgi:hypothetical protein